MSISSKEKIAVGRRLKQFRTDFLILNQKTFCMRLKIAYTTYNQYENGGRRLPQELLAKLNSAFNLNINWLLNGEGPMIVLPKEILKSRVTKKIEPNIIKFLNSVLKLNEENQKMVQGMIDMYLKKEGKK